MTDFDDLIDTGDLDPAEVQRLRRVHELLLQAGPPPELSPALEQPIAVRQPTAVPRQGELVAFPRLRRRRVGAWAAAAAVAAAAVFGGGYVLGHSSTASSTFAAERLVPMHGVEAVGMGQSHAAIHVAKADAAGNWPMLVSVVGLPKQQQAGAYYELWLSRSGKPIAPCGTFRVSGKTTTIRLTVPYALRRYDGWVITAVRPGEEEPGTVVMST
jgi:hypothetical protein